MVLQKLINAKQAESFRLFLQRYFIMRHNIYHTKDTAKSDSPPYERNRFFHGRGEVI